MAQLAIVLTNKILEQSHVISADDEAGEFIDQPQQSAGNTGSLTLVSSGEYFGSGDLNLTIVLKTAGDVGTAKYLYSDDSKTTFFGMNPVAIWTDLEIIKSNI